MNTQIANILLAEDDNSARTTLAAILEEEGHRVITCQNGAESLEHISPGSEMAEFDIDVSD